MRTLHLGRLSALFLVIVAAVLLIRACEARSQLAQQVNGDGVRARSEFKLIQQQIDQDERQQTTP